MIGLYIEINNDLAEARNLIKMSLELFHKVPEGAIETLYDEQNQPLFKRADLGKYLGIRTKGDNFKDFPSHCTRHRLEIEAAGLTAPLGRTKDLHDIFINLVKWLIKKGVERIQEEYQQAIAGRNNQIQEEYQQAIAGRNNRIQALEFTNEEHQQKILRLNKESDYVIKTRYVTRRGCFDNVLCFIKKNSGKGHPFDVNIGSLKHISDGSDFIT